MKRSNLFIFFLFAVAASPFARAADPVAVAARAAKWQLEHPVSFDIRWQEPGATQLEDVRLGWDGEILRRRTLPADAADAVNLSPGWTSVVRQAAGNIAFSELPLAAQAAWEEKIGLDPKHITGLKLMDEGGTKGWEMATFYVGLLALDGVAPQPANRAALRRLAEAHHWQLGARARHADDLLVGYVYLDFFGRERRSDQLAAILARLDWLVANPSSQSLDIREGQDRWTWCDALFMAPPVWLRAWQATGERRYLDYLDREWWATTDYLYSPDEKLFFRDAKFFDRREPNGQPVFWSRGNGWVLASLALMLPDLPGDLPSRPRYVALFQEMAARIAALQPADGLWRSSLLDPRANPQPESSATAFYCYALARGIRLGLLDREKFGPVVERAWAALEGCVAEDGRLGYVQQPGAAPGSADARSTAPYGVGALLLAATEVHLLRLTSFAPDFTSAKLAVSLAPTTPAFTWFGTDSLGRGENLDNAVLTAKLPAGGDFTLERDRNVLRYTRGGVVAWTVELNEGKITLHSEFGGADVPAFLLAIDQKKNHATLLARPATAAGRFQVPAVLHLPDRGTFRITASAGAELECDARRRQPEFFVRVAFPAATAANPSVRYTLESTLIHPELPGLADNAIYDGYRRNFLNLIQFHPRLRTLANNSSSDVCGFCFWQYAELAAEAPPLARGLTVMDLLRLSLDRVFAGGITYGQAGYGASPEQPEAAAWAPAFDSLDTLPSFVMSGAQAVLEGGDPAWSQRNFDRLVKLAREMVAQDHNGNGLIEYRLSGNSGTWNGKIRPANWWDTIGFGHEDGFSNALAYRALGKLAAAAQKLGREAEAKEFTAAAAKLKASYLPTLLNPATGVLAGWKSADGELHDYWFTFINGMAIAMGLVDGKEADAILDRMLAKMKAVGFDRFDLGLPGNLVPIHMKDYTDKRRKYGGAPSGDGSDVFQIYENGAATHCHAYWLVKALYRQGRIEEARRIYRPMLATFTAGGFQGFGPNGLSKDWRSWTGVGSGYEGYLSDGYLALLAVRDDVAAGEPGKLKN